MGMRFLQGTLVFKIFVLLSLFFVVTDRAYAALWFTTYGAGVLSGSSSTDSVKSVQPDFGALEVFKSTLIQPGTANPTFVPPDNTYDFSYGGILSSGDYEVFKSDGTTDTIDAYAKNLGALGDSLPDYQRFVDIAVDVSTVCGGSCNNILTSCNIAPGIYKAGLNCINSALNDLSSSNYSISSSGLVVLVQDANPPSDFLKVNNKITSGAPDKRLAIITSRPIKIDSSVGNTNVPTQLGYLSQDADIQAMLITTFGGDPGVEVDGGSNRIKIEGPIISKGKVSFKRDAGSVWPGVFVQFNPFYTAEFAKLDKSLNIFGSSSVRWSYE